MAPPTFDKLDAFTESFRSFCLRRPQSDVESKDLLLNEGKELLTNVRRELHARDDQILSLQHDLKERTENQNLIKRQHRLLEAQLTEAHLQFARTNQREWTGALEGELHAARNEQAQVYHRQLAEQLAARRRLAAIDAELAAIVHSGTGIRTAAGPPPTHVYQAAPPAVQFDKVSPHLRKTASKMLAAVAGHAGAGPNSPGLDRTGELATLEAIVADHGAKLVAQQVATGSYIRPPGTAAVPISEISQDPVVVGAMARVQRAAALSAAAPPLTAPPGAAPPKARSTASCYR